MSSQSHFLLIHFVVHISPAPMDMPMVPHKLTILDSHSLYHKLNVL
jgi:hypothetical protein